MGADFRALLKETCPQYFEGGLVCCDYDMLNTLTTQVKYPQQLFSRCPACLRNFIDHFCATTCDPNQSLYMNPTICKPGKRKNGTENTAVMEIDIYLEMEYAEGLYNSCSSVQYPQASNRVVDIMCGGTDSCNSTLWLKFLGEPDQNHNSPFPMNYIVGGTHPEDIKPKSRDFIPCNTNNTAFRCSCADCGTTDLCPAPPMVPKDTFPRTAIFWSIIGVGVCLSVVMFIATMVFGVFVCAVRQADRTSSRSKGRYEALENDDSPTSSVGSINAEDPITVSKVSAKRPSFTICMPCYISGANLENWIKKVFYHWGCFVAGKWYIVIPVGVFLVVGIIVLTALLHVTGTLPFTITTDPVKLWSAPDSRARLEKNYFDENFNPFYRTEMLIFTANDTSKYFTFQPIGVYGVDSWTFGPVFTNDVLIEVRKKSPNLYLELEALH